MPLNVSIKKEKHEKKLTVGFTKQKMLAKKNDATTLFNKALIE